MIKDQLVDRMMVFIETETRSVSMDFGCVTPLYVCMIWGALRM